MKLSKAPLKRNDNGCYSPALFESINVKRSLSYFVIVNLDPTL